jgi:hypothetical protein
MIGMAKLAKLTASAQVLLVKDVVAAARIGFQPLIEALAVAGCVLSQHPSGYPI